MKYKNLVAILMTGLLITSVVGCGMSNEDVSAQVAEPTLIHESVVSSVLDVEDMFSNKDLEQKADLTDAVYVAFESNQTVNITKEGTYVIAGTASNTTIVVEAEADGKVQLVLDGVSITNDDAPAIYVKSGDKVFVTTTNSENTLEVTGNYEADGEMTTEAVIYSKSDLVFNGIGTLEVTSAQGDGIVSKDDLKVTGGTYTITSKGNAIEANDSIRIYDGNMAIDADQDGLHSENTEDLSLGYIYIQNGNIDITSGDDAIHGTSVIQIDGGTINIPSCAEGIEATNITINNGTINIYATDDGINATSKSPLDVGIEVNGGDITIVMASGDTDGFDSNGDLYINGGNIDVTGGSTFDVDGNAELNGGTVLVNGVVVTELPKSQMGGGHSGVKGEK